MTRRQLDVFGSFLGPKFSAEPDIITSVMHAFSENPKRGLSEREFDNLVCELCKSMDHFYELCETGMDLIKKLVFINNDGYMDLKTFKIVWKYWIRSLLSPKSVLMVLNMQNDFLHGKIPGLSESMANHAINKTNSVLRLEEFELVIYVLESHPQNHISFVDNLHMYQHLMQPACCDVTMSQEDEEEQVHLHESSMFDHVHSEETEEEYEQKAQETSMDSFATIYTVWDKVVINTEEQSDAEVMLWPSHCVANSWGAQLSSQIHIAEKTLRVFTGTHPLGDSCSPFWEWEGVIESNLLECLRVHKVTDVYVCGVPTDISIVPTLLDCINHGMRTVYIADASLGLDEVATQECENLIRSRGVTTVNAESVPSMIRAEDRPPEMMIQSAINFAQALKKLNLEQTKFNAQKEKISLTKQMTSK